MRPRFLFDGPYDSTPGRSLEMDTRTAMRIVAGHRFRSSLAARRAALVYLLGMLQALPSTTFAGDVYPAHAEVVRFLRRHHRRIARIGGLRPGPVRSATFLPLRVTTLGRARRKTYRSSLDAPARRSDADLPVYNDVEIECTALMALWVDAWFGRDPRKFVVIESEYVPSRESATGILAWMHLPENWGTDRVEIFETLVADGLHIAEALAIADCL